MTESSQDQPKGEFELKKKLVNRKTGYQESLNTLTKLKIHERKIKGLKKIHIYTLVKICQYFRHT